MCFWKFIYPRSAKLNRSAIDFSLQPKMKQVCSARVSCRIENVNLCIFQLLYKNRLYDRMCGYFGFLLISLLTGAVSLKQGISDLDILLVLHSTHDQVRRLFMQTIKQNIFSKTYRKFYSISIPLGMILSRALLGVISNLLENQNVFVGIFPTPTQ